MKSTSKRYFLVVLCVALLQLFATALCFTRASVVPGVANSSLWQSSLAVLAFPFGYLANADVGFDPAIPLAIGNSLLWGAVFALVARFVRTHR